MVLRRSLAGCLAALVACSGSAAPKTSPSPADDTARARGLVITSSDLPAGWRSSLHRADPVTDREDRNVALCGGAPDPRTARTAHVFGMEFGQGAQTIGSEATYVRTAAEAAKDAAALKRARMVACLARAARPVVADQLRRQGITATIRSVRVARRTLGIPGVVSAFRISIVLVTAGAAIRVEEDIVFLARGRAEVRAVFVDVGVQFSQPLEMNIVRRLSTKLSTM